MEMVLGICAVSVVAIVAIVFGNGFEASGPAGIKMKTKPKK